MSKEATTTEKPELAILLVDDTPFTLVIFENFLNLLIGAQGDLRKVKILTAESVLHAQIKYDKCVKEGPKIIGVITDYNMEKFERNSTNTPQKADGDENGDVLIKYLREKGFGGFILGVSAVEKGQIISGKDACLAMEKAGANDYIVKPVSKDQLDKCLTKHNFYETIRTAQQQAASEQVATAATAAVPEEKTDNRQPPSPAPTDVKPRIRQRSDSWTGGDGGDIRPTTPLSPQRSHADSAKRSEERHP